MTQAQPPRGPRWWVHIAFVSGGVVAGLVAFAVAYWWFSARSGDSGQYDVVRSAVAATGVITVGAGAAVALRRQKTNEDNAARAQAAHELTQRTVEATLKKLTLEEDANRTDRYTKAVEQLGSDSIHVRLGGIYALKRLADDSERDLPTIVEVLAAFIRATTTATQAEDRENSKTLPDDETPRRTPPGTDVHAALTSLSRMNTTTPRPIDLRFAYLPFATLSELNLTGADLTYATLTSANLNRATLTSANLTGADLTDATLNRATLNRATLAGATLAGADLIGADLIGADLASANLIAARPIRANLIGARLISANLSAATLISADLTSANLTSADLTYATLNRATLTDVNLHKITWEDTTWPDGFTPPPSYSS